jgi:hypothetical protein
LCISLKASALFRIACHVDLNDWIEILNHLKLKNNNLHLLFFNQITSLMKISKLLFYLTLPSVFFGCSRQEFAYNEKATDLFLSEMKQIDEQQEVFSDSSVVFHPDAGKVISLNIKAENLINNSKRDLDNMADLKPSEPAKAFHQAVVAYFTQINQYGATAKKLLAADSTEKRSLFLQLRRTYETINQMPDQVLAIQKKYQNEVGMKAK